LKIMPNVDSPGHDAIVAPGDIVGEKYEVLRVLGSGGMGIVVAARHVQLGRMVAIKLLRRDMFARERSRARFEREGRVLATLVSEHVAKVHDIGTLETGEPFIVMELLEGETLGHRLRRIERLTVNDAVTIALHACEALAEAHAAGVVHRDLKPDNIFICKRLDDTEIVKLIDFGISKAGEEEASITMGSELIGTPAYTAPEQLDAPGTVDARADVWSLGAVLYESLSGRRPFEAPRVMQLVSAILKAEPTRIDELAPGLPDGLGDVIHACLAKDPAKRIPSVRELARRLAPFAREDTASLQRIESIERNRTSTPSIRPPAAVRRARASADPSGDTAGAPTPQGGADTSGPSPSSRRAAPSAAKNWTQTVARTSRRRVLTYGLGALVAPGLAVGACVRWGGGRTAAPDARDAN
jgi:serine/threonine-protein kinase